MNLSEGEGILISYCGVQYFVRKILYYLVETCTTLRKFLLEPSQ